MQKNISGALFFANSTPSLLSRSGVCFDCEALALSMSPLDSRVSCIVVSSRYLGRVFIIMGCLTNVL